MSGDEEVTFSLKALVNKDESKVLFVEADNDFVDVLLSFLTMPLGKIVKLLDNHYGDKVPPFGSLTSLYKGLQNLDSVHFWTEGCKTMLLSPRNSSEDECRKLKLNVDDERTKYFICGACSDVSEVVAMFGYDKRRCSLCKGETFVELPLVEPQSNATGVFTKNTAAFIIYDDLRIVPNSIGFGHCFRRTWITEMDGIKLWNISFGFNEIMDLLKGSLFSKTPLSDIILKGRCSAAANLESWSLFVPFAYKPVPISNEMSLKVMVQKSTNKLLFAQAEEDLVDFLFSFLAIPLGGVASLLQGNTSLTNIDNLYRDVDNSIPEKYFKLEMIDRLIEPKLGFKYSPGKQIFPFDDGETYPELYLCRSDDGEEYLSPEMKKQNCRPVYPLISPKVNRNFVKGPAAYMITDDLVITPFSMASSFAMINIRGIPISDVKEVDFLIGVPEALRILKASLTSRSVLTDVLLNPIPKEEPYQSS